ncbi:MAG: hypothetical protein BWY65_02280 [Firmicutes bacterium ADurb.Bin373]|nr:MAG: hypothetical protein BWY65_02280 [Firmicutes bacterium ADurb.Bin373]
MERRFGRPAANRADFYGKIPSAVPEFKPCAIFGQSALPDSRLLKGDLLDAVIKTRRAQTALMDALYVLESQLEAALDSDEEGGQ